MTSIDRDRLRNLIKLKGVSARSVSLGAGLGETAVKDILAGRSRDPGLATISSIAEALGVSFNDLVGDATGEEPIKKRRPREMVLQIRYEVGAGGFVEREDHAQEPFGSARVKAIRPYEEFEQWLERVMSDSMDKVIPVNSLLHVVNAIEIGYEPRHGDVVVVERTRSQGALVERTVKQVELTPAGVQLWPRSHNPRWQKPFAPADLDTQDDDVTISVSGLVIRSYQVWVSEPDEE